MQIFEDADPEPQRLLNLALGGCFSENAPNVRSCGKSPKDPEGYS